MKIAYVFLTRIPNYTLIQFAETLSIDTYIFIDDNNYEIPKSNNIKFIQIDANECREHHMCCAQETVFDNTKDMNKTMVHSWDKALYYFTYKDVTYDYVWFIEDDVFIPSKDAIKYIDTKYIHDNYDLLVANNNISKNYEVDEGIWHWKYAVQIFGFPSYCSMTCACRMSRKLLEAIKDFTMKQGFIPFHEFSFNTIAMKSGLSVYCAPELSTVKYDTRWTLEDLINNKNNLFHPMKNYNQHEMIRQYIKNISI